MKLFTDLLILGCELHKNEDRPDPLALLGEGEGREGKDVKG